MRQKAVLLTITFTLLLYSAKAQNNNSQTIRGQILEAVSQSPVPGAIIRLIGSSSELVALADNDGRFILTKVPVGRNNIQISAIGFESQVINELMVTSGKEVAVNIFLTEKMNKLNEVSVSAKSRSGLNEMATLSNRSFNPEETRKFAGTLGDPSRMIASGAGVASGNDSRNDIVVRGNSPSGILWQMEGIDIPNPNHYGSLSSTGGPVSMLNNNNLGRSEFFTGAFPAQYGNATSGVFDLRLRNGNADKQEFVAEQSATGFELGAEGPLSKKSKASYIVNYRYSTVGILSSLGLDVGLGKAVPQYQDLNFKISVPVSKRNKLSIWGMGGPSKVNFYGNDVDTSSTTNAYGDENQNAKTSYFKAMTGVTYETNFNAKTYGKLSLGYSKTSEKITTDSISTLTREAFLSSNQKYATDRVSVAYNLSHKFDAENSLTAGMNTSLIIFNLFDQRFYASGNQDKVNIDQQGNTVLIQGYAQWKHRFTERLSLNSGLHFQTLRLNSSSAVEPRVSLKYVAGSYGTFSLAYGMHSQMQSPLVYFYQTTANGSVSYTNKDLNFTKSQQLAAGYTYDFNNNLHFKSEIYYQSITNVPVQSSLSGFSLLNEGAGFGTIDKDYLVNNGTGKNYGIEFTLEKTFSSGSYFMINTSLFNSKYKGSDGVKRNTAFNGKYIFNALAGKEYNVGKNKTLSLNIKLTAMGGRYSSPVNVTASRTDNNTIYDETVAPFSIQQKAYFRSDFKTSYRVNYTKSTLEVGLDLQNLTGNKNVNIETFNRRTNALATQYQQGFLPVPYFRFTF